MPEQLFRSRVGEVLREQGRTVSWFCRHMRVSRALFYRIEQGNRNPSASYRSRAADILGVAEPDLFLPMESPGGDIPSSTRLLAEATP